MSLQYRPAQRGARSLSESESEMSFQSCQSQQLSEAGSNFEIGTELLAAFASASFESYTDLTSEIALDPLRWHALHAYCESSMAADDANELNYSEVASVDTWEVEGCIRSYTEEVLRTPEEGEDTGPSGCRERIGLARLDEWVEKANRMDNDAKGQEKNRRRRPWKFIVDFFGRCVDKPKPEPPVMRRRAKLIKVRKFSAADELKVKNSSILHRVLRRKAKVSEPFGEPVGTAAARKAAAAKHFGSN